MTSEQYGPVGTRILIETDEATVWEIRLEPHELLGMHDHQQPYFVTHTSDGHIRVTELDGTVVERHVVAGEVDWHPVGEIHELVNLSENPYSNVVVELRPRASTGR